MKVKVANASSRKTRTAIKSSFAQLLKEKREIKSITVSELVEKAGITRSSFYTHYDNIYDVAKDFQDELLDVLFNDINKINSLDNMKEYLEMIFNHLKSNETLYKMILSADEPLIFMSRLSKIMNKHLNKFLKNKNITNCSLDITFFIDGTIDLFIKYFRNEIDVSLEYLCTYVIEIFKKFFILT